jgi:NAD(P)-dependent dehydrogenase (short-subunit alcohol dehydrogenase family)
MVIGMDLEGKTILVTGASKGIGAAIVREIGDGGAHVIAHFGKDRAGADAATARLPDDRVYKLSADLSDMSQVDRLWKDAFAWRNRIDVVVNNAAVMRIGGGIEDDDESWDTIWDESLRVNVLAPARLMRHAVRHYVQAGGGILITLSSWAAQRGPGNPALLSYATTKAAILATTKTIARHYAKKNVLAYAIAPGVVRTQLSVRAANAVGGEAAVSAGLAMGEWIPPSEVAAIVAFLSTGTVRHLSGATLDINGASYIR